MMHNPPHPGKVVRLALIEGTGLTITQAAQILGVKRLTLSNLLNGKSGISPEMAVRLSIALYQRKTGFPELAPIDPTCLPRFVWRRQGSVEFQLGGKEQACLCVPARRQATGVYFPYMTVARDVANNAGNHNAKGINTSSALWLNMQTMYDLYQAEKKRKKLHVLPITKELAAAA